MTGMFLIADDTPAKLQFLASFVKREKWAGEIIQATTTEEAIILIDDHPEISAAFIDYYIPSQRGPAIIRHLREKHPKSLIALVSSADSEENNEEAKAAGANVCICTSIPERDLVEKLGGVIEEWKIL